MKRVYVAGPYSGNNVLAILDNIRIGIRASTEILLMGYSPFCPWLDYHFQLSLYPGEGLSVGDYYRYSIEWLKVSECMVVLPGWEKSEGTLREIEIAKAIGIHIFYGLEDFKKKIGETICQA